MREVKVAMASVFIDGDGVGASVLSNHSNRNYLRLINHLKIGKGLEARNR